MQKNFIDRILPYGGQLTVSELAKKYTFQKTGVRAYTRAGYKTVLNILEKDDFGAKRIDIAKLSDAKGWLIKLQNKDGKGYSSIHTIRGVLRPAFQIAVDDDLIRENPFELQLVSVMVNDSATGEAITHDQKRKFLEFVKNDKHFCKYYDGIYTLFHTPKTDAGVRTIPMTSEVNECFKRIIKNRPKPKVEPMVDGKAGFLYLD